MNYFLLSMKEKSSFIFVILENVQSSEVFHRSNENCTSQGLGVHSLKMQLYYSYILSFADTKKYESRILHLNSDLSVCNVRSWTKLQFPFLTKIQNRISKKIEKEILLLPTFLWLVKFLDGSGFSHPNFLDSSSFYHPNFFDNYL